MARGYDHLFKLVLVGDAGVGKTSLLLRFADDMFTESFVATIGIDFKIKTIEMDGKLIKLQIWDTHGGERFRRITSAYYRGTSGVLFIYDMTNFDSFDHLQNRWIPDSKESAAVNVCTILIGNKSDLAPELRVVDEATAKAYADEQGMPFIETSAKTSQNVELAFIRLAAEIKRKIENEKPCEQPSGNNRKVKESGQCCVC